MGDIKIRKGCWYDCVSLREIYSAKVALVTYTVFYHVIFRVCRARHSVLTQVRPYDTYVGNLINSATIFVNRGS